MRQMLRRGVANGDLAAGDGRQPDERSDLQIIRPDGELRAVQRLDAVNGERVGADAFDARAHLFSSCAQFLHVRLGGGIAKDRRAAWPAPPP